MNVEKCYFCGAEIPEGRQICPICEKLATENKLKRRNTKRFIPHLNGSLKRSKDRKCLSEKFGYYQCSAQ